MTVKIKRVFNNSYLELFRLQQSTSTTSTTATLQRLASLSALIPSDMEPPTISEIIQSNGVLLSPAPPPPPPPLSQQSSIDVPSTFKSAAPKKAILFRTTSQNDAETAMKMNNTGAGTTNSDGKDINNNNTNNGLKYNGVIDAVNDPKYNVPLIDQLDSKIDFNLKSNVLVAGKIVDQTTLQVFRDRFITFKILNEFFFILN